MRKISIIYIVAGLSSRFNGRIKQLIKIGPQNETLIEYSLNQALFSKFNKIIFVVGEKTEEPFKKIFKNDYRGVPVEYAFQDFDKLKRDKPWGTLDALCSARKLIDSPFIFCNGDDIYGHNSFKILFEHLQKNETSASIGYELHAVLPQESEVNRALFCLDDNFYVQSVTEIFKISRKNFSEKSLKLNDWMSMNLFALNPKDLQHLHIFLSHFKEENKSDRSVEALIQNGITKLIKEGKMKMRVYSTPDKWLGVTSPEDEFNIRDSLLN